jgi:hypothetical protein
MTFMQKKRKNFNYHKKFYKGNLYQNLDLFFY